MASATDERLHGGLQASGCVDRWERFLPQVLGNVEDLSTQTCYVWASAGPPAR